MVRFRNGQVTDVNQLINVKLMTCPTDEAGAVQLWKCLVTEQLGD